MTTPPLLLAQGSPALQIGLMLAVMAWALTLIFGLLGLVLQGFPRRRTLGLWLGLVPAVSNVAFTVVLASGFGDELTSWSGYVLMASPSVLGVAAAVSYWLTAERQRGAGRRGFSVITDDAAAGENRGP